MNTITKSKVLKTNKEFMLLNWIKRYFWEGKDIHESFFNSLNYYASMEYVEKDIRQIEIKDYIVNYVKSFNKDSVFNSFIRELLFTCYTCKNFKELMKDAELPFKYKRELHSFILNHVIPVIN